MKIFKHCLLFLIFLISSIYPQFGRWNNYHNYSSWRKVLEQIPKPGLKLLINPALQMGTTTSINSRSLNLKLGNNIVTNGDFHDFTFDVSKYSPVAYWVFDDVYHDNEATGKTAVQDLSGNGHDLSIGGWTDYNDLLTDMTGTSPIYQGGHGLKFPGVNEYLYIPAEQTTDFYPRTGDFSVALSFKTGDDITTTQKIYMLGYASPGYKFLEILIINEDLRIVFSPNTSWPAFMSAGYNITPNTLYNIVFVADRDAKYSLWINGVENVITTTSNTEDCYDANYGLKIGKHEENQDYFEGTIYSVACFNYALSEQEVKELYDLAKGWTWDGVGSVSNDNFRQVVSGGGTITQTVATSSGTMYKKSATTNDTTTVSYINEDNYTISLGDGTHDNISVRPVLNAVKPANFVEDFSKGGARYVEITAENQGTQSTSQIYANSTKTNYYWGDGSSAEVIGDFRVINGNHGIMMNNLEDDQPAHPASWKFNGINQYMNFGDILDLKSYDWLFADWVKDDNLASKYFISKYEDANNYWYIGTDASGNIVAKAVDGGTMIWDYVSQTALINDDWNFIAVARVGSNIKMWINGIEVNVTANTAVQSGSVENAGNLYKMRFNTTYSDGYDGIYPIYIFDGQDGAPNDLTESMEKKLIKDIYNITDGLYLQE